MSHSYWTQILFLLLFTTLAIANLYPIRDGFEYRSRDAMLLPRDAGTEYEDPACFSYCDLDTCGSDNAPSCLYSSIQKRSVPGLFAPSLAPEDDASALVQYNGSNTFEKRVWKGIDTTGKTIQTSEVSAYLSGQINEGNNYDDQYGNRLPVYDEEGNNGHGTELTMSQQWQFSQGNVQIGTGGLHGCTMLTVVSSRAVYMGKFESPIRPPILVLTET